MVLLDALHELQPMSRKYHLTPSNFLPRLHNHLPASLLMPRAGHQQGRLYRHLHNLKLEALGAWCQVGWTWTSGRWKQKMTFSPAPSTKLRRGGFLENSAQEPVISRVLSLHWLAACVPYSCSLRFLFSRKALLQILFSEEFRLRQTFSSILFFNYLHLYSVFKVRQSTFTIIFHGNF